MQSGASPHVFDRRNELLELDGSHSLGQSYAFAAARLSAKLCMAAMALASRQVVLLAHRGTNAAH